MNKKKVKINLYAPHKYVHSSSFSTALRLCHLNLSIIANIIYQPLALYLGEEILLSDI